MAIWGYTPFSDPSREAWARNMFPFAKLPLSVSACILWPPRLPSRKSKLLPPLKWLWAKIKKCLASQLQGRQNLNNIPLCVHENENGFNIKCPEKDEHHISWSRYEPLLSIINHIPVCFLFELAASVAAPETLRPWIPVALKTVFTRQLLMFFLQNWLSLMSLDEIIISLMVSTCSTCLHIGCQPMFGSTFAMSPLTGCTPSWLIDKNKSIVGHITRFVA